jgi:protein-disulfide isomerase
MALEERLKFAEMKARHQGALRPWYKKWWGALILLILGLLLIFLVVAGLYLNDKIKQILVEREQNFSQQQQQGYLSAVNGNGDNHYLGTAKPQVTIIEFGDFACSVCRQSSAGFRAMAEKYGDQVKMVWRDYPVVSQHSIILALAARCAGDQDKFWEFHDRLFADQADFAGAPSDEAFGELLDALAAELKMDVIKFDDCLNQQTYIKQINRDYTDGGFLEIIGTPTWFVNDYYKITGALSEEKLEELITGLLK